MTSQQISIISTPTKHQEVSIGKEDLFIRVGRDLYENSGFKKFNTFYQDTIDFKHNLNLSLLPYYYALDSEDKETQNELLNQILFKVSDYQQKFSFDISCPILRNDVADYFRINKNSINDLDHLKNGDYVISKIQLSWEIHASNLEQYHKLVVKKYMDDMNSRVAKKTLWESISYWTGGDTESKLEYGTSIENQIRDSLYDIQAFD